MLKRVKLCELKPGLVLAQTVPHPYGYRSLIKAGTLLTTYHIQRLVELNIQEIVVNEKEITQSRREVRFSAGLELANELYSQTYEALDQLFRDVRSGKNLQVAPVKRAISGLVDYLSSDNQCLLHLRALKKSDCASLHHSVNVSVFTILLGLALGIEKRELLDLGMAGLLHDIGKARIPVEILVKKGPLTSEEFEIIKNHPVLGHNLLKTSRILSPRVINTVLQHHEKCDGSGYPYGLKDTEIDLWAKIVTIADIYEALSSDRSYRQRFLPHLALEFLMAEGSKGAIDRELTRTFIRNISIYPIGIKVILSNNKIGKITAVPQNMPWRPTVTVGNKEEIHLAENPHILIKDIIIP